MPDGKIIMFNNLIYSGRKPKGTSLTTTTITRSLTINYSAHSYQEVVDKQLTDTFNIGEYDILLLCMYSSVKLNISSSLSSTGHVHLTLNLFGVINFPYSTSDVGDWTYDDVSSDTCPLIRVNTDKYLMLNTTQQSLKTTLSNDIRLNYSIANNKGNYVKKITGEITYSLYLIMFA